MKKFSSPPFSSSSSGADRRSRDVPASAIKRVRLRLVLALLVLAAIGITSALSLNHAVADAARVAHTHEVLGELEELFSVLKDVESGQRGYVMAADPSFIEQFESGKRDFHASFAKVRELTEDNPRHQARLDEMEPLALDRINLAAAVIQSRKDEGFEKARERLMTRTGLARM